MKSLKLVGASLLALAAVACESSEEKAVKFTENAQEYLDEGQLQRARLQFRNALQNDPNNVEALRGAAEVAEQQERLGDQLRFLQRLLNLEPDNLDAIAKVARLNLLSGNPDRALARANRVLEDQPDNIDALTVKGAALVLQNNLDDASEVLEQALATAPDNTEVRNLLAARYVRDEDFAEASRIIDEGLAANPEDEALLVVKLLLTQRRRDVDGMDETFAALVETSPENGYYRERYGEFLLAARRDLDGAAEQFTAAVPLLEDRTQVVGRLIGIVRQQESDEIAEERLKEIIATYPNDTNLVFALPAFLCEIGENERCERELLNLANDEETEAEIRARANVQLGERAFSERDFETAMGFADTVLANDESEPKALALKGKVNLTQGDVKDAIETLRASLASDPDNEAALILLGIAYEADGRAAFGEAQLAQAIDRLGLSANLFQAYRGMLVRNGKSQEAADLTLRFAQTPDATPEVQRESAAVLIGQDRPDEAEVIARGLIRADPSDQVARRILATAQLAQDEPEAALETLDATSDEEKNTLQALQIRSQVLNELERFDELRALLRTAGEEKQQPQGYLLLTQFEGSQENFAEAVAAARDGIRAFPALETMYVALYNAELAAGDTEAATAVLTEGIEQAETTASLRLIRSNELLQNGNRDGAKEILLTLRDDEQLNDLAANNLAALMLDDEGREDEALEIAKRFEGTEQPFFADTLAWAYFKTGDLDRAQEYATIAARADLNNAEILYHQGVIAAATGNPDEARSAFERALEAPGKSDSVNEAVIQQALDNL